VFLTKYSPLISYTHNGDGTHLKKKHFTTLSACLILMKLENPRQIFEKDSHIKFHENPPSGIPAFPRGRRHTDMAKDNSILSQFCRSA